MIHSRFLSLALAVIGSFAVTIDQEGLPDTGLDTTSWVAKQKPPLSQIWSLNDFQIAAKNVMSLADYYYYRTAALDEITYHANLDVWKNVRLNGFSFQDVSNPNTQTSILGYNFSAPFFIAPAAQAGRANSTVAEVGLVQGAANGSILYVPSISSTLSIEQIAAAAAPGQVMFHQEYVWSDQIKLKDELRRMEAAGFKAIFLTVDNTGVNGVRTRQLRVTGLGGDTGHSATFDFNSLAAIQNMTSLPVVPKGIRSAADARTCLQLGFPAIYVTNHGGRTLDGAPTAVEILLDIRKNAPEVFDKMEVYADGGVRRGSDVIKLLALGARAVGLGRSPMFANIYGAPGVAQLISMMKLEMTTTLALLGQSDTNKLNSTYINTKAIENMWF